MIRKAVETDVSSIMKLGTLIDCDYNKKTNLNEDIFSSSKEVYVYAENNIIKGFITILNLNYEIEIIDIAVFPEFRKAKIATKLLSFIFNIHLKNCYLEVRIDNKVAINLYKKFNFNVINIRKKYYKNMDAYIMERKI